MGLMLCLDHFKLLFFKLKFDSNSRLVKNNIMCATFPSADGVWVFFLFGNNVSNWMSNERDNLFS